jgi:hypothetical protein
MALKTVYVINLIMGGHLQTMFVKALNVSGIVNLETASKF